MIRGRLETIYSQGYLEGWAYDPDELGRPVLVEVVDASGASVAMGLALGYREALAQAGLAGGWASFRLRVHRPAAALRGVGLVLIDPASGEKIFSADSVPFLEGWTPEFEERGQALFDDPFTLERVAQLAGLTDVFAAYLAANGPETFVAACFLYLLERPADREGSAIHTRLLTEKTLGPFELMEMMSECKEFKSRPRKLASPKAPAFPFFGGARVR